MEEKSKEQEKLSYEELEKVALQMQQRCEQLFQRCTYLERRLEEINATSLRLEYLFKVIKHKDSFSSDFSGDCIKEIEEILTIKNSNTEDKGTEK